MKYLQFEKLLAYLYIYECKYPDKIDYENNFPTRQVVAKQLGVELCRISKQFQILQENNLADSINIKRLNDKRRVVTTLSSKGRVVAKAFYEAFIALNLSLNFDGNFGKKL